MTERTVSFLEASGEVGAHVFVPDGDQPVPGIVFSHSAIHRATASTNLLRFARALARAGAASVVLDGTIEWDPPNDNSRQPYHLTRCAAYWLLANDNIDGKELGHVGPGAWSGSANYFCVEGEPPCWMPRFGIDVGRTSNAEYRNTERMLTAKGRFEIAQWIQHEVSLREVRPEWFGVAADFAMTSDSSK